MLTESDLVSYSYWRIVVEAPWFREGV